MGYQVNHDAVSLVFIVLAGAIFMYVGLWETEMQMKAIFAAVLLFGGLIMSMFMHYTTIQQLPPKALVWTGVAFGMIMLTNFSVSLLPALSTTPINWSLFAVLIAISEEQFFRGFMTPFFANRLGMIGGSIAGGVLFGFYHYAVYSADVQALLVVTVVGIALSYIALYTKSATPGMVAHALNNFLAAVV